MKNIGILKDGDDTINKQKDFHDESEILSGDYWVNKETGELRLIRSLTVIDNILHSVKVLAHPERRQLKQYDDLTLDAFLNNYYYIDQEEAKKIRQEEIQRVQIGIQKVGEKLAQGYIEDSSSVSASAMLASTATAIKSDMSLPISMAQNNQVEAIKANIEHTKDIAEKQNAFIEKHTAEISKKTKLVATYYTEISEQNLASIEGTMTFVEKLNEGVKTLDIFLGDGVQVMKIADGEPASDEEVLTFYQRKLFLDEEFFYDLANGGADCNSLKAFSEALENGSKILDTIAPSPKSVVLMQFRRERKRYDDGDYKNMESIMEAFQKEQADKEMFLFIRNGKRVHLVFSDDIMGGARLFPTNSEINAYFKDRKDPSKLFDGVEVDNYINFHDIRNAEARDKFDAKARYYQRIILMLNGIHSREEDVFGKIRDEGYRDWLSLEFQQKYFSFIHDDEDALAFNTLSLSDFVSSHNRRMQAGSRVIGDWERIADEDNAKGLYGFSDFRDAQKLYDIVPTSEPLQVSEDKKGIYVTVKAKHGWSYPKKEKNVRIYLDDVHADLLCVDYVKSNDIQYYLDSRHARASYAYYAQLLIGARDMLEREEKEAKPVVEALSEHILNLYPQLDEETIDKNLFESLALWKITNKKERVLYSAEEGCSKMITAVSDIFYDKTIGNKKEDIILYANKESINALCITMDGKRRYYLYSEVKEEDKVFLGLKEDEDYPFVCRDEIVFKRGKLSIKSTKQVQYSEYYRGEDEIHRFYHTREESKKRHGRKIDNEYVQKIEYLHALVEESKTIIDKLESGEDVDEMLLYFLEKKEEKNRKKRSKYVLDYRLSLFVGAYMLSPHAEWEFHVETELKLIEYYTNIDMLVAVYGSDALYERLTNWIAERYKNPMNRLSILHEVREKKTSAFIWTDYKINLYGGTIPKPRTTHGFLVENQILRGTWDVSQVNEKPLKTFDEIVKKKEEEIEKNRLEKNADKKHQYVLTTIAPKESMNAK